MRLNDPELIVDMPTFIDTENNPVTVIQTLPRFMKYDNGKYYLRPNNPGYDIGIFLVRGEITDGRASTQFKFFVNVVNDPPDFEYSL